MKVAISGGTGFIGKHLTEYLHSQDHEVIWISRSRKLTQSNVTLFTWSELEEDPHLLEGVDAVVNLAGESINQLWTAAAKKRILESRLNVTRAIARVVEGMNRKPEVIVNGSGMSVYGSSETDTFDETSPHRLTDYLAEVVEKWEEEADGIQGARVVKLRVGLVLGSDGGALPKMLLPYRLFAGGRLGSGRQWISWIHVEDMARLIAFCIMNRDMMGPVNAVGPHPVTNRGFGKTAGRVLRRPDWFPVPGFLMKGILGELSVLLLEGQRVIPAKALDHGFVFTYPDLENALAHLTNSRAREK